MISKEKLIEIFNSEIDGNNMNIKTSSLSDNAVAGKFLSECPTVECAIVDITKRIDECGRFSKNLREKLVAARRVLRKI